MSRMAKRIIMSVAGVVLGGMSVGLFKLAAFGVDPFQSLMSGLEQLVPIPFGTLYVIVNALLLIFSLIADRHYINLATFINLFLLGYVVQFSYSALLKVFPAPSLTVRIIAIIVAIIIICIASSAYMTADLGVSTYDAVALIFANKWKLGKFKYIRIITDVVCIVLGAALFLLGGGKPASIPAFISVGTIITAFFMGPLIEFFNKTISRPLLDGKKAEQ